MISQCLHKHNIVTQRLGIVLGMSGIVYASYRIRNGYDKCLFHDSNEIWKFKWIRCMRVNRPLCDNMTDIFTQQFTFMTTHMTWGSSTFVLLVCLVFLYLLIFTQRKYGIGELEPKCLSKIRGSKMFSGWLWQQCYRSIWWTWNIW